MLAPQGVKNNPVDEFEHCSAPCFGKMANGYPFEFEKNVGQTLWLRKVPARPSGRPSWLGCIGIWEGIRNLCSVCRSLTWSLVFNGLINAWLLIFWPDMPMVCGCFFLETVVSQNFQSGKRHMILQTILIHLQTS